MPAKTITHVVSDTFPLDTINFKKIENGCGDDFCSELHITTDIKSKLSLENNNNNILLDKDGDICKSVSFIKENNNNYEEKTTVEEPQEDYLKQKKIVSGDNKLNKDKVKPQVTEAKQTAGSLQTFREWFQFKTPLIWLNIVSIIGFHFLALYSYIIYPYFNFPQSFYTILWAIVTGGIAGFGVTAGAHRLWAHRSYKAKLPLRIILMLCYATAGQNRLYDWVRDHRVHHKYSETDADPHNANRGFFFAHVGWLMMRKHPDVLSKGKKVDMSDILEDPVVQFFERYFITIKLLCCFIIPSAIPPIFWNESWKYSILSQAVVRYVMSLNFTWLVNSAAHIWGNKPYDKRISPAQNLAVSIVAMGEGWHNYHHVFPWDYKAAELGNYRVNVTTFWLDLFSKIGWAYDLKTPSNELVRKVIEKTGDGTHPIIGHVEIPEDADKWRKVQ